MRVDEEKKARLVGMLGGYEHVPSKEQLYAVEQDVDALRALLRAIYEDEAVKKGARQRALALMHHSPGEATTSYYEMLLDEERTAPSERRVLVRAYAALRGAEAVEVLSEQLQHEDGQTRAVSAVELGQLATPEAIAALEARAEVEREPHVRRRIGQALGREISDGPAADPSVEEVR